MIGGEEKCHFGYMRWEKMGRGTRITIDNSLKLSEVKSEEVFKDCDGDEYIVLEHFEDRATMAIKKAPPPKKMSFGNNNNWWVYQLWYL